MSGSGWAYTQAERDEATETADCPECEVLAGDPCVGFNRVTGEPFDYESYAHLPRMLAVFGRKEEAS